MLIKATDRHWSVPHCQMPWRIADQTFHLDFTFTKRARIVNYKQSSEGASFEQKINIILAEADGSSYSMRAVSGFTRVGVGLPKNSNSAKSGSTRSPYIADTKISLRP